MNTVRSAVTLVYMIKKICHNRLDESLAAQIFNISLFLYLLFISRYIYNRCFGLLINKKPSSVIPLQAISYILYAVELKNI